MLRINTFSRNVQTGASHAMLPRGVGHDAYMMYRHVIKLSKSN